MRMMDRLKFSEIAPEWKLLFVTLVVARFTQASIWFSGAVTKTPWNGWGWFPDWVAKEAEYARIPPYKWFLENIVIPNIEFFGWVQFLTEWFLAITLFLGIAVGFAGVVAGLWALNIAIGSYPVPGEQTYLLQLFVLVPFLVGFGHAGRILGVDAWLHPRLAASDRPLLRWIAKWAL